MVPVILELPFVPTAIEFLERELIDMVEKNLKKPLPVSEGEAVLIVMYDASTQNELDTAVEMLCEKALEHGAIDVAIADTPERADSVWSVRGGILEAMKAESVAQEECDVVVPRAHRGIRAHREGNRRKVRHLRGALRPLRRWKYSYRDASSCRNVG